MSRVLFFETGLARKSQIEEVIKTAIDNLDIQCSFSVNLVMKKDGKKMGHAYVWFTNPKVVNALVGKNYDGSDRICYKDDPEWKKPEEPIEEALRKFHQSESGSSSDSGLSNTSWADDPDENEVYSRYVPSRIREV